MNDPEKLMPELATDTWLLEQLSRLRTEELPAGMAAGFESRLLEELLRHHVKKGPARFLRAALRIGWEPVLIAFVFAFLTWDLVRIIGFLFG